MNLSRRKEDRLRLAWRNMRNRCDGLKPGSDFRNYYMRGITVCEEWDKSFFAFRQWAIKNGYSPSLTIDRIDNDKGYTPSNCRWVSRAENLKNSRGGFKATKLTAADVSKIRAMRKQGVSIKAIAAKFSIHPSYCFGVVSGRKRKSVE